MDDEVLNEAEIKPTVAERFFFENNGYLVLERLLAEEHVAALTETLQRVVQRRRDLELRGEPHTGTTYMYGDNTRIFYILNDDPLFLDMVDLPAIWPYVIGLLNPMPHHHACDAFMEVNGAAKARDWHIDGHNNGYRLFRQQGMPIPLLQLKIGYYLSDMSERGQGNLCVIPGSHKATSEPDPADLQRPDLFPGAIQVCAPPGSAILFHNALWHSSGPWTKPDGRRTMLYYAYEHPWMLGSQEHWGYPPEFYNNLSPERRKLFHGFVFDPPEQRWG